MVRVSLYGKHSNRTPLAYEPYQRLVKGKVVFESSAEKGDVLLLGFKKDLIDNRDHLKALRRANPRQRVFIISEEPLWDSVWSGDFLTRDQTHGSGSDAIPFRYLNHANSKIFHFGKIPYFPTTNTDFLVRYATLFARNAAFEADDLLATWKAAPIQRAYYLEKRTTQNYGIKNTEAGVVGLSLYRSQIAEMDDGAGVIRAGQGWGSAVRRQDRPDWHLEKLAALDRRAFMVSALENTVAPNYITEKIFDAFATLAIPFYYAGPDHAIRRVISEPSFVDLHGHAAEAALAKLRSFAPDREFAERYLQTQRHLAALFRDTQALWSERAEIAARVVQELASN
jgi:hypothetical protein